MLLKCYHYDITKIVILNLGDEKMMICIYYNPKKQEYYAKIIKNYFNKEIEVGRKTYGRHGVYHELVAMFYLDHYIKKPKLINCKSWSDYSNKTNSKNIKEKYFYLDLE